MQQSMSNGKLLSFLLLAAVLGSTLTLGVYRYLGDDQKSTVLRVAHDSAAPAVVSRYDENGDNLPTFTYAAEKVMPSVVHIKSTVMRSAAQNIPDPFRDFFGGDSPFGMRPNASPTPQVGTGSGVIISEDGYIVTNNHVIDQAEDIEVSLSDNRTYKAKLIGTDPSTDIALIKIDATDMPAITLGNSDQVRVGEWVLAIGNPFNLNSTVTAGIVSAKARNINILHDQSAIESFIQTDAAVNPGNSGGALVDLNGNLIGINTAIASPTGSYSGYSFAVPVTIVRKVMEDLLEYGTIQRAFLGVIIRSVDGNLAKEKGLDFTSGVYVDSLMDNGAAKDAGVKKGDVIIGVNGLEVKTSSELQVAVGTLRPGDLVKLKVMRDGDEKELSATLRNKQGNTDVVKKEDLISNSVSKLGIELEELSSSTARQLKVDGGVRVTDIGAGVVRDQTKMREGFVITHVDGRKVSSMKDLQEIIANKEGGVMVEGVYPDQPGRYYYAFGL
ncbi:MAG: Do family serine endopeptidase [Bacteroidia bacterium]|nr:Do family serine endopeptidase [Bacteroidia bacterium]